MTDPIEIQEKITIHKSKLIIDSNGYIYNEGVLKELAVGSIVRIFITLKNPPLNLWSHDSPYISIIEMKKENDMCLGEILDLEKLDECNKYPLACGERIWFNLNNIIEIPLKEQSKNKEKKIKTFLSKNYVTATGPLYTIENIDNIKNSESDYDSDSSNNSEDSYSD